MATITKRDTGWLVQIRRKGHTSKSRTFRLRAEALEWARAVEAKLDMGHGELGRPPAKGLKLSDLIDRYLAEVTPRKLSCETERSRLTKLLRHPIAGKRLDHISPSDFAAYRDERLQSVSAGTVRRELGLLHHLFDVGSREWCLSLGNNPLKHVTLPRLPEGRQRRLEEGELEILLSALDRCRNPEAKVIVLLAIETGLRRREIFDLTWRNVDLERHVAFIPYSKTGQSRMIPLTENAVQFIAALPRGDHFLFSTSMNAFKLLWRRVQARSGLEDLRFHDLRHEALSRFCELGLNMPELALISGHRDPRMLFRYSHLRADLLAKKLAQNSWQR
ncbi:MAG: hypothetical protein RLZZ561_1368 [Pseudomonadota bacterium]|jgi:integrase